MVQAGEGEGQGGMPGHGSPSPRVTPVLARRRMLAWACGGVLPTLGVMEPAHAGAQVEEPIADAVRSALSAAIADRAPPKPRFTDINRRLEYLRWLGATSDRLRPRFRDDSARIEFLETAWYESRRAGLETALILGLIQVESGFRKYAISVAGARGYMQVMPFWARLIGDGEVSHLFHMQTNLRFGCSILRHYLNGEGGNLFMALGRYNGSRGRAEYPDAVVAARRQWDYRPSSSPA